MPPTISEAPPRRRLHKTSSDAIVSMFEGRDETRSHHEPHHLKMAPAPPPRTAAAVDEHQQQQQQQQQVFLRSEQQEQEQHESSSGSGSGLSNLVQQQQPRQQLQNQSQQTDTLTRDFQLLELVLNTPSSAHGGMVTREHAMTRAMLERQLAQRIVDARLDERYLRQGIEEAHADALEAIQVACRFHAAAIRDVMMPEGRPVFVQLAEHEHLQGENEQLRDKIDLLERRLQANAHGVHFLPETVRFAPPPPSYEALEKEEEKLRAQLLELHRELYATVTMTWAMSPRVAAAARTQAQRQRILSPQLALMEDLRAADSAEEAQRREIEQEEGAAFGAQSEEAAGTLAQMMHALHREKEQYRCCADSLAIVAAEAAARAALEEVTLEFTAELLRDQKQEMLVKTELTRKLRNSVREQHGQAMRHKKEMDVLLPPVSQRSHVSKMSSIQQQQQNRKPMPPSASPPQSKHSAQRLNAGNLRTEQIDSAQHSLIKSTVAEARKAAAVALSGGAGGGSAPSTAQGQRQQQKSSRLPAIPQAESARKPTAKELQTARAPLYNAGFSRPYGW